MIKSITAALALVALATVTAIAASNQHTAQAATVPVIAQDAPTSIDSAVTLVSPAPIKSSHTVSSHRTAGTPKFSCHIQELLQGGLPGHTTVRVCVNI